MRTLFWCCCAIVITVASLVYVAADYAREHPNSVVGRCVLLAYRVRCDYNPVTMLTHALTPCDVVAPQAPATQPDRSGVCVHAEDGSGEIELTPAEESSVEIIDLTRFSIGDSQESEEHSASDVLKIPEIQPPPAACDPSRSGDTPVMVPPTRIQEEDDGKAVAPGDDEECEVPATMPKDEEKSENPGTVEESEFKAFIKDVLGYPESEQEPPMDKSDAGGSEEESEAIHDSAAPENREDTAAHHQYPGCPYMGGCPGSSHAVPVCPSEPAPHKHKKKKKAVEPMTSTPSSEECEPAEVDEECPDHSDVDTTEFRKSDARQGEFSRRPF
jgi:hypothetical protein